MDITFFNLLIGKCLCLSFAHFSLGMLVLVWSGFEIFWSFWIFCAKSKYFDSVTEILDFYVPVETELYMIEEQAHLASL